MAAAKYYGLVGALPRLPHFEAAEYLPITELQLTSRLTSLSEQHRTELDAAAVLMLWPRQPMERNVDFLVQRYGKAMQIIQDSALRDFVEYRLGMRTVVVALRMRRKQESPQAGVPWGVGRWTRKVAANWDDTDFRIGAVYPWVESARALLEQSNALELERLLLNASWQELSMIESRTPFGFERVFAFLFKWDIVRRWLAYDADVAKTRFQGLITEVIHEHEQLFA